MIVSRYLSEPEAHDPVSTPHAGSEFVTRLSKVWRVIRRGRVFDFPFPRPRQPFQRLEFWTVRHPLVDRLKPYDVSVPRLNVWRGYSWATLRYWEQLLDEEPPKPGPVLDSNGIMIAWYNDGTYPAPFDEFGELVHAEPFSD